MTNEAINSLLASYPRKRPPLTGEHEAIYVEEYKLNRGGNSLLYRVVHSLEVWGHRVIASNGISGSVLELGAGSLNHVPFEDNVPTYDCVEPLREFYENSPHRSRVGKIFDDIKEVPESSKYERVVSFAVLEHLDDLPSVVAQSGLKLASHGVFQAVIPTEGGFLWGMAWRCTTGIAYRMRTGLDYKVLMRHEHINTALEITGIVRYFFRQVRIKRFPLPMHHLSFYNYLEASDCNTKRCTSFLAR